MAGRERRKVTPPGPGPWAMPGAVVRLYGKWLGLLRRLTSAVWVMDLRLQGVRVGRQVQVRGRVRVNGGPRIVIGNRVRIHDGVCLNAFGRGQIIIGDDCLINRLAVLTAWEEVRLGRGVGIGPFVHVTDREHRLGRDRAVLGGQGGRAGRVIFED